MTTLLRKAYAFVLRDFRSESSYKASFVMSAMESLMLLMMFYFLSRLITSGSAPSLSKYGDHYLPYVLIGLGFARYFDLTLRMFSDSIRQAQVTGCLEAMLSSQTDCVTIVLMSSLYALISGAVQLILILLAPAFGSFWVDIGGRGPLLGGNAMGPRRHRPRCKARCGPAVTSSLRAPPKNTHPPLRSRRAPGQGPGVVEGGL